MGLSWKKKQGTGLKTEEGLPVSRYVRIGKDLPELQVRTHMKQGLLRLANSLLNHTSSVLSCPEGLSE